MSQKCRYCCKSPKLPGANFPAVKKSDRRLPIDVASITLPGSPASFSSDDEVLHIFTWKSPVQPKEILIASAKRLLQQNRSKAALASFRLRCLVCPKGDIDSLSQECNPGHGRLRVTGVTECPRAPAGLFRRLDVGRPDHLSPLLAVGSDPRAEFLRTARDRVEAERRQAFLDLRQCHDFYDLAVEQGDDLLGRSAGDRDGKPRYAFHIRIAGLRHRGHIRQRRHPRLAGDRKRAQLTVLEVRQRRWRRAETKRRVPC